MVQDMTDPTIEPSTVRDQLLKLIESFGLNDSPKMADMRATTPTEYLPGILERYIKSKCENAREAGELKGLNEAARDIGVWKTFDKAADARAAIKEQYAKLQEKREKDTMSTPDLFLEAADILGETTIKVKKSSGGFQVEAGGGASVGNDFSLRQALLTALKKSEESKLTMKQHLAIKALIEKAVGLCPAPTSSGPWLRTCRSTCAATRLSSNRLWQTGTRRASRQRLRW